jgi:hypothetical protein
MLDSVRQAEYQWIVKMSNPLIPLTKWMEVASIPPLRRASIRDRFENRLIL